MYHRQQSITPSQQAVNGALDLFVEGALRERTEEQRVGLTVMASATEAQLGLALSHVEKTRGLSAATLRSMLAT